MYLTGHRQRVGSKVGSVQHVRRKKLPEPEQNTQLGDQKARDVYALHCPVIKLD